MRYSIEPRQGYLYAVVSGRDTAEQMREFHLALHDACRAHGLPKVLISVRRSRAIFKPEDYGLDGSVPGYASGLLGPDCRIAVVGDTDEVHAANEYIELVARQQNIDARAFRDEAAALRWLGGAPMPVRRYRFTRTVIAGAPEHAGVYTLWEGNEVIYYGNASAIRARLLDHLESGMRATHYEWEVCADPGAREAELLREHARVFGRLPRHNGKAA